MVQKVTIAEILMGLFAVFGGSIATIIGKNILNISNTLIISFIAGIGAVIGFVTGWFIGKLANSANK